MELLDVYTTKNTTLKIELNTCDIPSMKYTERVLRDILLNEFHGNVSEFLVHVGTSDTIAFSFTADDYVSLMDLLEQAQYTLIQAHTIIRWIDHAVAADSPDPSWGPIYYEILEGAR